MAVDDENHPLLLSRTLARLLRSHVRMKTFQALNGPELILEREAQLRDRYLDRLVALVPTEFIHDKDTYSMDCVLRAFRDEVLADRRQSPEAGPDDLPPEIVVAPALGDDSDEQA